MIKQIQASDLERCLSVIRESFATVAKEFNLTEQNCPTHTSFTKIEKLEYRMEIGNFMYGYFDNGGIVGYVSLEDKGGGVFELKNLAVLPEYRHKGFGAQLLGFCKEKARELGGSKITIDIIEENTVLKDWYAASGFVHTGTKTFGHLPFTAGYMECRV